ncbi:ABC transporter, substrate binding protein [Aeropyrum pernix]|uniref:ABC transporter, substrate binding protein n=1 Tax=Aeropyrum pernix TaxID=56636 RepID=A0A401H835_AERPX|nr:ABC transporter substrate-binding protein [Aeropyrum pernix]GBF08538.1 ABC transporter, substrate binding protein [Aeropyrum pernix]
MSSRRSLRRGEATSRYLLVGAAIVVVIILLALGYYFYSQGAAETTTGPLTGEAGEGAETTPETTTSPAATETPEEVTLIWASTQLVPPTEQQFVKEELLPPFTQETGIKVEFIGMSYGDLNVRLQSEMESGKVTISLIADLHGGLDLYASKGWLEDLSKFGALEGREFPQVLEDYSRLYGIKAYVPWLTATYVFVVNKEAFKYLPPGLSEEDVITGSEKWTYDALLEWAKNIEAATGQKPLGFPAGPKGLFHRFLHGYLYPSFTGAQVKNFDSPEAVQMWSYLKELWNYVHPQSTVYEAMAAPLLNGEVLIAWDHTARIKDAIVQKPDEFVVVPAPAGPKGRGYILVIVGLAIPKNAPHQDAAWRLIEYLTRPEVQSLILEKVGFFPAVSGVSEKLPEGPLKVLAQGVGNQLNTPDSLVALIPSLGEKGGDFSNTYREAFKAIVLEGKDPQQVLPELKQYLLSLFQETGASLPPPDE